MRCLTLAEALKKQGSDVAFICRAHEGHLLGHIEKQGFKTHALPQEVNDADCDEKLDVDDLSGKGTLYGRKWLGSTQQQDAELCRPILEKLKPDWVIVDHYSLDEVWQTLLAECYAKLMVIDDLANREHRCDLLLDQTYGRKAEDYASLVPKSTQLLLGSEYALLRPEFAEWRDYSLQRRANPEFKKLLITMGGVDSENVTGCLLTALNNCSLPKDLEINIVMGMTAPHLENVKQQAKLVPYKTAVYVNVSNMAEMMANADLAIGAAGATTWERCCLGLPSIQIVLAKNQMLIAALIGEANAALYLDIAELDLLCRQINKAISKSELLATNSSVVTNGRGTMQLLRHLK